MLRSTKLKPCIGAANLVRILTGVRAPAEVFLDSRLFTNTAKIVQRYLALVSDPEKRFIAAKSAQCHEQAVQVSLPTLSPP